MRTVQKKQIDSMLHSTTKGCLFCSLWALEKPAPCGKKVRNWLEWNLFTREDRIRLQNLGTLYWSLWQWFLLRPSWKYMVFLCSCWFFSERSMIRNVEKDKEETNPVNKCPKKYNGFSSELVTSFAKNSKYKTTWAWNNHRENYEF